MGPKRVTRGKRARSAEKVEPLDAVVDLDGLDMGSVEDADNNPILFTQLSQGGTTRLSQAAARKVQTTTTKQYIDSAREHHRNHAFAHAPAHPTTHWDKVLLDALQRHGYVHTVPVMFNPPRPCELRPAVLDAPSASDFVLPAALYSSSQAQPKNSDGEQKLQQLYHPREHKGLRKVGKEMQVHFEAAERQRKRELDQQAVGCNRTADLLSKAVHRRWNGIHNALTRQLRVESVVKGQMEQERKQEAILQETEEITADLIRRVVEEAKTRSRQRARRRVEESGNHSSENGGGAPLELEGDKSIHERDLILLNTLNGERPLRDYQRTALQWMVQLYTNGLNGILADEMGLGKTVQTIALLCFFAQHRQDWGPHLIVVPTTVVLNWEAELMRWAPGLKTLTYIGSAEQRKRLRVGWSKEGSFDVCITSYNLIVNDRSVFRRRAWGFLILDEAHQIKNFASQKWQSLFDLQAQYRLLLTGTPLQNSVMELWSLLHFLLPNATAFSSHEEFQRWYSNPMNEMVSGVAHLDVQVVSRLQTLLRPFMLRRLKKDVESQLPTKREVVIRCKLSLRQQTLYQEFMSLHSKQTAKNGSSAMESVFGAILHLRKACNHPALFEDRSFLSSFVPDRHDRIRLTVPSRCLVAVDNSHRTFLTSDEYSSAASVVAFSTAFSSAQLLALPGWCGLIHGATPSFLAPPTLHHATSQSTLSPTEGEAINKQQWLAQYDVSRLQGPSPPRLKATHSIRLQDVLGGPSEMGPRQWVNGLMSCRYQRPISADSNRHMVSSAHHRKHKLTAIAAHILISALPPIELLTVHLVQPYLCSTALAGSCSRLWGATPVTATGHSSHQVAIGQYRAHLRGQVRGTTLLDTFSLFGPRAIESVAGKTYHVAHPPVYGWSGSIGHAHPAAAMCNRTVKSGAVRVVLALVEDLNMRVDGFAGAGLGYGGGSVFGEDCNGIGLREVASWKRRGGDGSRFPVRFRQHQSSLRNVMKQFAIYVQTVRVLAPTSVTLARDVPLVTSALSSSLLSETRHRIAGTTSAATLGCHAPELEIVFPVRQSSSSTSSEGRSLVTAPFVQSFGKSFRYHSSGDVYDGLRHFFHRNLAEAPTTYTLGRHVFGGNTRLVGPLVSERHRTSRSLPPHPVWEATTNHVVWTPDRQALIHDSGKLQVLAELLPKLRSGSWYTEAEEEPCTSVPGGAHKRPHRALIFTQFTAMLDILQRFLAILGIPSLRIDGATKPEVRQQYVDRFNRDERITCMVLSTRSGGIGLNLTGADTVIFYDSDWNPTVDLQAQDRVHRIGQTRNVTIYRLVVGNSIEEKILEKARQRKKLNNVVIKSGAFNQTAWDHHQKAVSQAAEGSEEVVSSATDASSGLGDSSKNYLDVFRTLHSQQSLMTFFHANDEDAVEVVGENGSQDGDLQKAMAAVEDKDDQEAMAQFEMEEARRKVDEATAVLEQEDKGDVEQESVTVINDAEEDGSGNQAASEGLLAKRVEAMKLAIERRLASQIERNLLSRLPTIHPNLVVSRTQAVKREEEQAAK